jgi:hypothetical protein
MSLPVKADILPHEDDPPNLSERRMMRLLPSYFQRFKNVKKITYPLRSRQQKPPKSKNQEFLSKHISRQAETDDLMDRLLHIQRQGPD